MSDEDTVTDQNLSDSGEEGEEVEEEPLLKYTRLYGSLMEIFEKGNEITAFCVGERFMALGTQCGFIYLLDFEGNIVQQEIDGQIKPMQIRPHEEKINELSLDERGEFIASCSVDGKVVLTSLFSKDMLKDLVKVEYKKPVHSVAIDPCFGRKNDKAVVSGGASGKLLLNKKGWFGSRKDVLVHEKEGPIYAVKWYKDYITWANEKGVKVYDAGSDMKIGNISRKQNFRADQFRCNIVWDSSEGEERLYIGWGPMVQVVLLKSRTVPNMSKPKKYFQILYQFNLDDGLSICGLAVFKKNILALTYEEDDGENGGEAPHPELMMMDQSGKEICCDTLSIREYNSLKNLDYRLEYAADEDTFYIVSKKDIIVARPRDVDDHIKFLLKSEKFEEALQVAKENESTIKQFSVKKLGNQYLNHLIAKKNYQRAASVVESIAKKDKEVWEHWIGVFYHHQQVKYLSPYVSTTDPQLDSTSYELLLNDCLRNQNYDQFEIFIKTWPPHIYHGKAIIKVVEQKVKENLPYDVVEKLYATLATLYEHASMHEQALGIFFKFRKIEVFDYVTKYNLLNCVRDHIQQLMDLDEEKTISFLLENLEQIPVDFVIEKFYDENNAMDLKRIQLKNYLKELEKKKNKLPIHRVLFLVELYAQYETHELFQYLKRSESCNPDEALQKCQKFLAYHENEESKKHLYMSIVYLYGRIGNSSEALNIIINKLADVSFAIEFVKHERDPDLWKRLIDNSLKNSNFIAGLLDHIGEFIEDDINPEVLIRRIPDDMEIKDLKYKLANIISGYSVQKKLQLGAKQVLLDDTKDLSLKLHKHQRKGTRISNQINCVICKDILKDSRKDILLYFCGHAFHKTCYVEVLENSKQNQRRQPSGPASETSSMQEKIKEMDWKNLKCLACNQVSKRPRRRRRKG